MERALTHTMKESSTSFSASGKGKKCRLGYIRRKKYPRMRATPLRGPLSALRMRILASASAARTVAGEEEVCRVRVGERERGKEERREGGDPGEREKERERGSNYEQQQQQLPARARIYCLDLPWRKREARMEEGCGGRGCLQRVRQMKRGVICQPYSSATGTSGSHRSETFSLQQEAGVWGWQLVITHHI